MAAEEAKADGPTKLVVRNIGLILSGALEKPILDGDAVVAVDGRISAVGPLKDLDAEGATTVVDAKGAALTPGLIDSHVHPVAGDWTPRQSQLNWIDSSMHGGVTTMIPMLLNREDASLSFLEYFPWARQAVEEKSLIDSAFSAVIGTTKQIDELVTHKEKEIMEV